MSTGLDCQADGTCDKTAGREAGARHAPLTVSQSALIQNPRHPEGERRKGFIFS